MVWEGGFCYCIFTSWNVAPANFYWGCELKAAQKMVCVTKKCQWTWLDAYTHFKQKIRIKKKKKAISFRRLAKGENEALLNQLCLD